MMHYHEWYEVHWKSGTASGVEKFSSMEYAQDFMRKIRHNYDMSVGENCATKYRDVKTAFLFRKSSVQIQEYTRQS